MYYMEIKIILYLEIRSKYIYGKSFQHNEEQKLMQLWLMVFGISIPVTSWERKLAFFKKKSFKPHYLLLFYVSLI